VIFDHYALRAQNDPIGCRLSGDARQPGSAHIGSARACDWKANTLCDRRQAGLRRRSNPAQMQGCLGCCRLSPRARRPAQLAALAGNVPQRGIASIAVQRVIHIHAGGARDRHVDSEGRHRSERAVLPICAVVVGPPADSG
jgi:hypothetical protein